MPLTFWTTLGRRLRDPSPRLQRAFAIAAVATNAGIAVTGSIVRVTGSGLGCPTWPECVPGSMTPVAHPELSQLHQWIEYSNRLLTGVVGIVGMLCLLSAWWATPRRRRVVLLSMTMVGGVAVQAVLGGITVQTGLLWWTVAVHFLASTVLVWFAVTLVFAIDEGDQPPRWLTRPWTSRLLVVASGVLVALLAAGTLVTGAGPHAGDADVPRLGLPVDDLVRWHAALLYLYLAVLVAVGVLLRIGSPEGPTPGAIWRRYVVLIAVVLAQGLLGFVQYWLAVPGVLVVLHVLGAMAVTVATASMWCATRDRGRRPTGDQESAEHQAAPVPAAT